MYNWPKEEKKENDTPGELKTNSKPQGKKKKTLDLGKIWNRHSKKKVFSLLKFPPRNIGRTVLNQNCGTIQVLKGKINKFLMLLELFFPFHTPFIHFIRLAT